MKVIKQGRDILPDDVVEFECMNCSCVFRCEEDEYHEDVNITLTSYPEQHYVYASCPHCHKIVCSRKRLHDIKSYSVTLNSKNVLDSDYYTIKGTSTTWAGKPEKNNSGAETK